MRSLLVAALPLMLFSLAGCGSGGDGGDDGQNTPNPPPPTGVNLGSRSVPGYAVQVSRTSVATPGQSLAVRITVTPEADRPQPQTVEGWAGGEFDGQSQVVVASAVAGQPGTYDAAIPLPAPLPSDWSVWTRLRLADGSVLELGRDDFKLGAALK